MHNVITWTCSQQKNIHAVYDTLFEISSVFSADCTSLFRLAHPKCSIATCGSWLSCRMAQIWTVHKRSVNGQQTKIMLHVIHVKFMGEKQGGCKFYPSHWQSLKKGKLLEKKLGYKEVYDRTICGTSLVIQCLRVHLRTQSTWIQSLVRELKIPHAQEKLSPIIAILAATREAHTPWGRPSTAKKKKKSNSKRKRRKGKNRKEGKITAPGVNWARHVRWLYAVETVVIKRNYLSCKYWQATFSLKKMITERNEFVEIIMW